MKTKTRIYLIRKTLPVVGLPVLVEASSAAQATAYVAANLFTVSPATGLEIAAAMKHGATVDDASKAPVSAGAPDA